DGAIANPGAWTHYSYAIRDALELFDVPIVEVHLSNVDKREEWRRTSVISDLAAHRVVGKGPDGYREAIEFLVKRQCWNASTGFADRSKSRSSSPPAPTS